MGVLLFVFFYLYELRHMSGVAMAWLLVLVHTLGRGVCVAADHGLLTPQSSPKNKRRFSLPYVNEETTIIIKTEIPHIPNEVKTKGNRTKVNFTRSKEGI